MHCAQQLSFLAGKKILQDPMLGSGQMERFVQVTVTMVTILPGNCERKAEQRFPTIEPDAADQEPAVFVVARETKGHSLGLGPCNQIPKRWLTCCIRGRERPVAEFHAALAIQKRVCGAIPPEDLLIPINNQAGQTVHVEPRQSGMNEGV